MPQPAQRTQVKIYIEKVHERMLDTLAEQGMLANSRTELLKLALIDFLQKQSETNDALKEILNDMINASKKKHGKQKKRT